jgi:hypothetical protein
MRVLARIPLLGMACLVAAAAPRATLAAAPPHVTRPLNVDLTGTVTDSTSGQPLPSAEVSVSGDGGRVANTTTDGFGRYTIHNLAAGTYTVAVHFIGFAAKSRPFTAAPGATATQRIDFAMVPIPSNLAAVQVVASVPITVDTRTGDQVFKQNDFHGAPTTTTSQILQQSIVGAARAPTGEVHIRGQHAEYTYYVDGVPVTAGISGSLNELFDPQVVNQITFETGGWDAEYGNKNAAIVNITTRIPAGGFHANLGSYLGAFSGSGDKTVNGQSLTLSGNSGPWGLFVSGARQFSDMRQEPVVFDTTRQTAINFHNNGTDAFGFGKIQYTPGARDVVSLDGNVSQTRFAVPFDSSGGTSADDHQRDINSFLNLGWRHQFGDISAEVASAELFGALFFRHGGLTFTPGSDDDPQFVFFPDTTAYNLAETRNFNTYGVKLDYTTRPAHELSFKVGTQSSLTRGREDFTTVSPSGKRGPASNSDLKGSDVGVYVQTAYSPQEWVELRAGARYDAHNAPFASTQTQLSPRIRLNLYPTTSTTLYGYYGRQFIPTNVEDLRAITSVAQQGVVADPTLPERDHFFETGLIQRFPAVGVTAKGSLYYKVSKPGVDDNTVPGSAIVTEVNLASIKVTGLEGVLEYRPDAPFSAYMNAAIAHAYGRGPITGGFFPEDTPQGFFDLDHDQRVSLVGSATYSPNRFFTSVTGIYGSGLTNGVAPEDCGCSYGTGLFDLNQGTHVSPATIMNVAAGYTLIAGASVVQPQLYVDNVFDKHYLLKGAFFSGASVGRPRSVQLRLNVSF